MESTPTGDTSLNLNQAQAAIKGILSPVNSDDSKKPDQKAESTEDPKPQEDAPKAEGQDEKADADATSESGKDAQTDAKTEEEIQLESLEELAEATGLPLERILNLKARTKVDGAESQVSLAEIVKSYQLEGHLTRKSQELAEKAKAFEAEREKQTSDLQNRLLEANQLIGHFEQQFMAEFNSVNWPELRQTDPAEFAAKKQEYNERWNQLQSHRQQVISNAQKVHQENQQKAQEKFQEILRTEEEKLLSKFPDWKDPEKAKVGKKEVGEYLTSYGFKPEEISQIYDHRQVDIVRKAMLYDKMSTKTDVAKKKVAVLPKVLKPSANKDPKRDALVEGMKRLEKSGRIEDAAAVLKLRLKGK